MKQLPAVPVKMDYFALKGGLNLTTPPLTMPPGFATEILNFECDINGGYTRISGYERYSGQTKPSDALYYTIPCSTAGTWSAGATVTGATSGATATYLATSALGLIVTKVTGTFQAETLNAGGGTATGTQFAGGAASLADDATYLNLAADVYRALIAAVPGSGSILGIVSYYNVTYVFRNNAGGTAADLYKSSSSGWVNVPLGRELNFTSGGTYEIVEGDTITGATSGATAVITRVVREFGSWAAGTAAGRLIFASDTGTFQAENLNVGANLNVATIAGDSSAITLTPGGRYEFDIHNFGGGLTTSRIYGASGVHRGFEFDGTVFVPISTGMATDTPEHVIVHKEHLFFSFAASNQHSGPGLPYVFSAVLGAGELSVGDAVSGYVLQPGSTGGGTLAIITRNRAFVLYGNDVGDWNLTILQEDAGGLPYTTQSVGGILTLDDRGVAFLGTSQNYGNFEQSTITHIIQPYVREQRGLSVASMRVREKNQYRLFFTDSRAIYITMNGQKVVGMTTVTFANAVTCCDSAEMSDGSEVLLFGSTNGMVYQLDRGTSHDGTAIDWTMELAFNNMKSPQIVKRFRKIVLEMTGSSYAEFSLGYQLGYGATAVSQPTDVDATTGFDANSVWDTFVWDNFFWDGNTLAPSDFTVEGSAENIAIAVRGSSDKFLPFTFTGAMTHYTPRQRIR